ncbi:hypothetical protein H0H93_014639, partial [Arthromyces matolae]
MASTDGVSKANGHGDLVQSELKEDESLFNGNGLTEESSDEEDEGNDEEEDVDDEDEDEEEQADTDEDELEDDSDDDEPALKYERITGA